MTRAHWFWGIFGILISLFLNLSTIPLFDVDEGAFAEATREMLARGDFLTTYLDGALRFDKPILIYWLQALSVSVLGLTEGAVRLPSVLASLAWAGLTFFFGRRYFGTEAGFWAAFFLALALQVSLIAKAAIADALLNLWVATALFAIFRYHASGRRPYLLSAYAAMALGMLTKGPVAVLIPFATTFLYYLSLGRWRDWLRGVTDVPGLLLFLVIAGPWFALEYAAQGQAFIDGFFLKHNVDRFQGPMEGHTGSLLYYVPVVLLGVLPFTGLILRGLRPLRALWADSLSRFLLLWFTFVFVFFSISGTKLPHYVIYGYTPLFLLAGRAATRAWSPWMIGLWPLGFLGVLAALPLIAAHFADTVSAPLALAMIEGLQARLGWAWSSAMLLLGVALLVLLYWGSRRGILLGMGIGMAVVFHGALLPQAAAVKQGPIREAGELARRMDVPIHLEMRAPSFLFYARSTSVGRPMRPGDWVLIEAHQAHELPPHRVVRNRNGILLAEIREED
ncbi:glycosyltransferase family 39 protein [Thiohalorhabdus methylotrophus]|uniref:Glycosyltransferase family 39 protein n=1 Tax=Thiohalorhabdus methylotrophus TaxID=3242694 RepID=A0ABV4TV00_9GAMM